MHPLYKKRFVVRKKYYAHDEGNVSKMGDIVKIRECRPVSKLKKRKLIEVVKA
jgi:small subunit ribosomal protein S17